jgi:hypothetical protein
MNTEKLNDWMQVVGIFALVASLIFVGLQMKQDHKIAMAEAYHARAQTTVDLTMAAAANPLWLSAQDKWSAEGPDSLTPEERLSNIFVRSAILQLWDSIHYQYVNGFIDEEHWQRTRTAMRRSMRDRSLRDVYEDGRDYFRPSYRAEIDRILDELDAE